MSRTDYSPAKDDKRLKVKGESLYDRVKTESVFISGRYYGKDIGSIIKHDPNYCCWIMENQPKGVIGQQIRHYFNKQEYNNTKHKPGIITGSYKTPTHNFDGSPVDFTQPPF